MKRLFESHRLKFSSSNKSHLLKRVDRFSAHRNRCYSCLRLSFKHFFNRYFKQIITKRPTHTHFRLQVIILIRGKRNGLSQRFLLVLATSTALSDSFFKALFDKGKFVVASYLSSDPIGTVSRNCSWTNRNVVVLKIFLSVERDLTSLDFSVLHGKGEYPTSTMGNLLVRNTNEDLCASSGTLLYVIRDVTSNMMIPHLASM